MGWTSFVERFSSDSQNKSTAFFIFSFVCLIWSVSDGRKPCAYVVSGSAGLLIAAELQCEFLTPLPCLQCPVTFGRGWSPARGRMSGGPRGCNLQKTPLGAGGVGWEG